jgi:hypothetical protein
MVFPFTAGLELWTIFGSRWPQMRSFSDDKSTGHLTKSFIKKSMDSRSGRCFWFWIRVWVGWTFDDAQRSDPGDAVCDQAQMRDEISHCTIPRAHQSGSHRRFQERLFGCVRDCLGEGSPTFQNNTQAPIITGSMYSRKRTGAAQ